MTDLRHQPETTLSGSYTLERELGGGMSRVFAAVETRLGRKVVVKVLSPELAAGISAVATSSRTTCCSPAARRR
jgi:serine/threonine-protein kinase